MTRMYLYPLWLSGIPQNISIPINSFLSVAKILPIFPPVFFLGLPLLWHIRHELQYVNISVYILCQKKLSFSCWYAFFTPTCALSCMVLSISTLISGGMNTLSVIVP